MKTFSIITTTLFILITGHFILKKDTRLENIENLQKKGYSSYRGVLRDKKRTKRYKKESELLSTLTVDTQQKLLNCTSLEECNSIISEFKEKTSSFDFRELPLGIIDKRVQTFIKITNIKISTIDYYINL